MRWTVARRRRNDHSAIPHNFDYVESDRYVKFGRLFKVVPIILPRQIYRTPGSQRASFGAEERQNREPKKRLPNEWLLPFQ